MLVQLVCLGRVVFGESTPEEAITTAIEFARLADMCGITGKESLMGDPQIQILVASRPSTLLQQSLCLEGIQCVRY